MLKYPVCKRQRLYLSFLWVIDHKLMITTWLILPILQSFLKIPQLHVQIGFILYHFIFMVFFFGTLPICPINIFKFCQASIHFGCPVLQPAYCYYCSCSARGAKKCHYNPIPICKGDYSQAYRLLSLLTQAPSRF